MKYWKDADRRPQEENLFDNHKKQYDNIAMDYNVNGTQKFTSHLGFIWTILFLGLIQYTERRC
jgi:hypothetical protein